MYLQCWHGWCHMELLPSQHVLCTPYNHAPCHFMQSHIRKVYACLAVTCHLHFWPNDPGLLRATAVKIKITSRTCRFEICRYLQLPHFKSHFMRTGHIFNSVPQSNQSSPPSLSLSCTHTHTRTEAQNQYTVCLNTEIGGQANCSGKLWNLQHYFKKIRHYVYCL